MSIVCFRVVPPALADDGPALDALNRAVLGAVQLGGAGFLSSTVLGGRFWLRACVVNPRATADDVDAVLAAVRAAARDAVPGATAGPGAASGPNAPPPGAAPTGAGARA
jgi:glutamate/tyrosine decarboxylase-like PLP-dependent enzyme